MRLSSPSTCRNTTTEITPPKRDLWDGGRWYLGDGLIERCRMGDEVAYIRYPDYIANIDSQIDWMNGLITTSKARLESSTENLTPEDIKDLEITIDEYTAEKIHLENKMDKAKEKLFNVGHQISQNYHQRIFHENWSYHHLSELHQKFEAVHSCITLHTLMLDEMEKEAVNDPGELPKKENDIEFQKKKIKEFEEKRERIIDTKIAFLQHLYQSGAPLQFPQIWIPKT